MVTNQASALEDVQPGSPRDCLSLFHSDSQVDISEEKRWPLRSKHFINTTAKRSRYVASLVGVCEGLYHTFYEYHVSWAPCVNRTEMYRIQYAGFCQLQLSKWFCDIFTGAVKGAARYSSFVEGGFGLLVAGYV
jgi:hypothetical protein